MNKIYKLVYSKSSNSLVAVSELASQGLIKSNTEKVSLAKLNAKEGKGNYPNRFAFTFLMASLFLGLPLGASASQVETAKKPSAEAATLTNAQDGATTSYLNFVSKANYSQTNKGVEGTTTKKGPQVNYVNGVPVIDIVAPVKGVSDNRFKRFNTDTGAIFNNQVKNSTITVDSKILQQKIAANPNLKEAAQTILAQVTGNDKSVIEGALEVLGQKADLLLINPNGIDLNGVELVNIKDFTASTAQVNNNNFNRLQVNKGEINVNNTLTSDDVSVIRLIAKAVKIKAAIAPKTKTSQKADIYVAGGKGTFNLKTNKSSSPLAPKAQKEVVISGSALGSMYGNKVNFIVSQSGAGVDYDGLIIAEDDLVITAQGDVKVKDTFSRTQTTITSKKADVTFKDSSKQRSLGNIVINADHINGSLATLMSKDSIELNAQQLELGNINSNVVKLNAQKVLNLDAQASILANNLDVLAGEEANFQGKVKVKENFNLAQLENAAKENLAEKAKLRVTFNNEVLVGNTANFTVDSLDFNKGSWASSDEFLNNALLDNEDTSITTKVSQDLSQALYRLGTLNLIVSDSSIKGFSPVTVRNSSLVTENFNLQTFSGSALKSALISTNNASIYVKDQAKISLLAADSHALVAENSLNSPVIAEKARVNKRTKASGLVNIPSLSNANRAEPSNVSTLDDLLTSANPISFPHPSNAPKVSSIETETQLKSLSDTLTTINSPKLIVEGKNLKINNDNKLELANNLTLSLDNFTNEGIINSKADLNIESKNNLNQSGLILTKGNLSLSSAKEIDLEGNLYVEKNLSLKAPRIEQSSQILVGGDMLVSTNNYHLWSKMTGEASLERDRNWVTTENWHYHRLRKDHYTIIGAGAKINTKGIKHTAGEINVQGNYVQVAYQEELPLEVLSGEEAKARVRTLASANGQEGSAGKSALVMDNGRLYIGGNAYLNGDLTVRSNTFKVNLKDFLSFQNPIYVTFKAVSLINSDLSPRKTLTFNSLYDLLDTILHSEQSSLRAVFGYQILRDQVINTLKQVQMDPIYYQMLAKVFGANWNALTADELISKWDYFKANANNFNIDLFAPDSEIMTKGNFSQENGKVFIGADNKGTDLAKVNRAHHGLSTEVLVESSETVLITEKLQADKSYDDLLKQFSKEVVYKDNKYQAVAAPEWAKSVNLLDTLPVDGRAKVFRVNLDNPTLSLFIYEQFKTQLGGYAVAGKNPQDILKQIAHEDKKTKEILANARYQENDTIVVNIDGQERLFFNRDEFNLYLKLNYSHIDWWEEKGILVPTLTLSEKIKTEQKITNFDAVASSVSSSKSIKMRSNDDITLNYGSLNARDVSLEAQGNVNLRSSRNENAINAKTTRIQTEKSLEVLGNLNSGDTEISALNDANFNSLAFYSERGFLTHQAQVLTKKLKVKAKNINSAGVDFKAKESVKLEAAEKVNLKAVHNEASTFENKVENDQQSGHQIATQGQFVKGSTIKAKTVDIASGDDVTLESSTIKADQEIAISATNVNSESKADQVVTKGTETKNQIFYHSSAGFGNFEVKAGALATTNTDINGLRDIDRYSYSSNKGSIEKDGKASFGVGINIQSTKLESTKANHQNNEINSKKVTIEAKERVNLGNLNINNDGSVKDSDAEKEATIIAKEVVTNQNHDIEETKSSKVAFSLGVSGEAESSLATTASHITSTILDHKKGETITKNIAATTFGDASSLLAKDLLAGKAKVGASLSFSKGEAKANKETNSNLAGSVSIKTSEDTHLRGVKGDLRDLDIKAKNVTIENTIDSKEKHFSKERTFVELSGKVGISPIGSSTNLAVTSGYSKATADTEEVVSNESLLKAETINIESTEKTSLQGSALVADEVNIKAKEVSVISAVSSETTEGKVVGSFVTAGVEVGKGVSPFVGLGAFKENHQGEKTKLGAMAGVDANKLNIDSEKVELSSALLNAEEEGSLNAKEIVTRDNNFYEHKKGSKIGGSVGLRADGHVSVNIAGGKDLNSEVVKHLSSTVTEKIKLDDHVVIKNEETSRDSQLPSLNSDPNSKGLASSDVQVNPQGQENQVDTANTVNPEASLPETKVSQGTLNRDMGSAYSTIKNTKEAANTFAINLSSTGSDFTNGLDKIKGAKEDLSDLNNFVNNDLANKVKSQNNEVIDHKENSQHFASRQANEEDASTSGTKAYSTENADNFRTVVVEDMSNSSEVSYNIDNNKSTLEKKLLGEEDLLANIKKKRLARENSELELPVTGSTSTENLDNSEGSKEDEAVTNNDNQEETSLTHNHYRDRSAAETSLNDVEKSSGGEVIRTIDVSSSLDSMNDSFNPSINSVDLGVLTSDFASSNNEGNKTESDKESVTLNGSKNPNDNLEFIGTDPKTNPNTNYNNSYGDFGEGKVPGPSFGKADGSNTNTNGSNFGGSSSNQGQGNQGDQGSGKNTGTLDSNHQDSNSNSGEKDLASKLPNLNDKDNKGNSFTDGSKDFDPLLDPKHPLPPTFANGEGLAGNPNHGSSTGNSAGDNTSGHNSGYNNSGLEANKPSIPEVNSDYELDFSGKEEQAKDTSKAKEEASIPDNKEVEVNSTNGGSASSANTITEDSSETIADGNAAIEAGKVEKAGDKKEVKEKEVAKEETSEESSPASDKKADSKANSKENSKAKESDTSEEETSSTQTADKKKASDESSEEDSTLEDSKENDKTKTTSLDSQQEEASPADGNAKVGESIPLNSKVKVVKYQVGDLNCYVLAQENAKEKISENQDFQKFIQQTAKSRATLFSTYSGGIENAIGENGVICIPASSSLMQKTFNVVQHQGDIPIIKNDADNDLEALVLTKRRVTKVKLSASKAKIVNVQPEEVKVKEVKAIQNSLKTKGIESEKILILGVKGNKLENIKKSLEQSLHSKMIH